MRQRGISVLLAALALPGALFASPIFTASGAWTGEGRIVPGVNAPLERGRCRVELAPGEGPDDVSVTGKCVVAAGASQVAMRFIRDPGGVVRAGFWSASTDQTIQMRGQDDEREMVLNSLEPVILNDVAYESRVTLGFPAPDQFTIQQIIRAPGETAWRLVVEMAFQKAPGD